MNSLLAIMWRKFLIDSVMDHSSWLFQLESSVPLFPTLPIPWCLCWIKRRVAVPLRSSRDLDLEVGFVSSPLKNEQHFGVDFSLTFHVLCRCMEGTLCPHHHDRHSDCTTVVYLWFCEGLLQAPSPSSPWDARVSEEEAWVHSVDNWKQIWTESACWSVLRKMQEELLYIWQCRKLSIPNIITVVLLSKTRVSNLMWK